MIDIKNKQLCCGCSACFNVCPTKCIEMVSDEEGFLYPNVNKDSCINCGKCEKVCSIYENIEESISNYLRKAVVVQNFDSNIREESTSGGFFSLISSYVISQGGVVIGAAYDANFKVVHQIVDNISDLAKFRNSKYCQSDLGKIYSMCKDILESGKKVCFSGTPCQTEGLYKFLGGKPDNLILVDFACHGVPSPGFFQRYIKFHSRYGKVIRILFRDKHDGYFASGMGIQYSNGKILRNKFSVDAIFTLYFSGMISRPSCYKCRFKKINRITDFTMMDCWHAENISDVFDDKGATGIIIQNEKAKKLLSNIIGESIVDNVELDELIKLDGKMIISSAEENPNRMAFFTDYKRGMSYEGLIYKYKKYSRGNSVKYLLEVILHKTGIFNKLMRSIYLTSGRKRNDKCNNTCL